MAVKLRRADLSVVTSDELGPGDTFGEASLLDERRSLTRTSQGDEGDGVAGSPLSFPGEGSSTFVGAGGPGGGGVGGGGGKAAGRSMETYQTLEVRETRVAASTNSSE